MERVLEYNAIILENWKTAGLDETSWEEKGRGELFNEMREMENVNL